MKTPPSHLIALFFSLAVSATAFAGGVEDEFSEPRREDRQALRGAWKFENNTARCVADPELFKKFDNHGPILRWPVAMTDGTIECEFQPNACEKVVLTLNETGHVFRVILMDGSNEKIPSRILGWPGPSKTTESDVLVREGVPFVADVDGSWVKFKMIIEGDQAVVTIGDHTETLQHASIARPKGEFTLSFAAGELAVRNVAILPTKE